MRTNHPFAVWKSAENDEGESIDLENLNVVDELNRPLCADCRMPRSLHPSDEPDRVLGIEDLRRPI
jgi:hypothetical protein